MKTITRLSFIPIFLLALTATLFAQTHAVNFTGKSTAGDSLPGKVRSSTSIHRFSQVTHPLSTNFGLQRTACTITCPADITVASAPDQCGAIVTYPDPTTGGACGTVTTNPASGSFFPVGTTTVTATSTAGPTCTFTVTVTPLVNLTLTSAPATTNQFACYNNGPITPIVYTVSDLGNGAVVVGLPAGLTGVYAPGPKTFTISGTPTASGTFPYTVTATGSCVNTSLSGTITVYPLVSGLISGPANASVCAGQSASVNINLSGVPNFSGVFTIAVSSGTGTPTPAFNFTAMGNGPSAITIPAANLVNNSSSITNYNITWVSLTDANGCLPVSLTGSANITVYPVPVATATLTNAGDVCPGTNIVIDVANPNLIPGALFHWTARDNNGAGAILGSANNVAFGNGAISTSLGLNCPTGHINPIVFTIIPVGPAPLGCTGTPVTTAVNVRDVVAPSLITPGTLPGGALGNVCLANAPVAPSTATIKALYQDNCSSAAQMTITGPVTTTTGTCVWTRTYSYTITDLCGNATVANVIYSGADTQVPTWTTSVASLNTTIQCTNDAAAFAAQLAAAQALVPVASDNCASSVTLTALTVKTAGIFAQAAAGTCITAGTYTNTFLTNDGCGNFSTGFTQVITIVDNTAPTLGNPGGQTLDVGAGTNCQVSLPDYRPLVTYTDCTPMLTMTQSPAPGTTVIGSAGPGPVGGSVTVTITATDGCGNISTRDILITLNDATAPVARCHNVTVSLDASGTGTLTPAMINGNKNGVPGNGTTTPVGAPWILSSDNCGLATFNAGLTFTPNNTGLAEPFPAADGNTNILRVFKCNDLTNLVGSIPVTLLVTDLSGNTATCIANVTVIDITAPVVTCAPVQTLPKNATCTTILPNLAGAGFTTATDACGPVTITQTPAAGSIISADVASLAVTFVATDGSGNTSACTTTIQFRDQTAPVITGCPANITVSTGVGNTDCQVAVNWTPPTGSDNCSPILGATVLTSTHTPGQLFFAGVTTVTYTATDVAGNTATCSFTVTVIENTLPTITCLSPGNKVVGPNSGGCSYTHSGFNWDATGADNCIPLLAANYTFTGATTGSGPSLNGVTFNGGVTTVTWRVVDQSNNSTTCSYTVTVTDNIAPVITCPATVNVNTNAAGCKATVAAALTTPVTSDNCAVTLVEWSVSGATPVSSGLGNLGNYTFNIGTSLVTYRVSDAAGNSVICSFNVVVTNAVAGAISGTATAGQNAATTSTITFTGSGGSSNYTFAYTVNGGATQTVSTTGGSTIVTVAQSNASLGTFVYNLLSVTDANGCPGAVTLPASATITVVAGMQDLTNSQFFTTTQIAAGGTIDEVVGIRNVGSAATTAPVVFSVTNYSAITGLSAASNTNPTVTIGFTTYTLDNANWTITSTPSALTFTSNAGIFLNPGQTRFLGVRITRAAGANGTVTHSSTIVAGTGGGESPTNNNSISNTLLKN
jgi:hypothetical protein